MQAAREHGVRDARVGDMFALAFPRDRFRSVLVNGTQVGLAGSLAGVSAFLGDLACVTDGEVTREVGRTLQFVLFGPDRLAEAAVGTPWRVAEVRPQEAYYRAVLEK